jgi:hypothetical protein
MEAWLYCFDCCSGHGGDGSDKLLGWVVVLVVVIGCVIIEGFFLRLRDCCGSDSSSVDRAAEGRRKPKFDLAVVVDSDGCAPVRGFGRFDGRP